MSRSTDSAPRRPAWNEAAIWMGADLPTLLRLFAAHRFRIPPAAWLDAAIDLAFGAANSGLRAAQASLLSRRVEAVRLDADPIFIVGHWRTGTTLLHELMSLDPRRRFPTTFECFLPHHFLLSERLLKPWTGFVLPATRPPDNMRLGWDLPQEDEFALCNLGVPSPYLQIAFPNEPARYDDYFELDRLPSPARERWKRSLLTFLKRLTFKRPGQILLKSPTHTFRLPTLLEMFPDARFLHIVRDPYDVFSSTRHLWRSLFAVHGYQTPRCDDLDEFVFSTYLRLHRRLDATRGAVASNRFHEIRYERLVGDPVGQLREAYARLELTGFDDVEPALAAYAARHARYKTNRYELDVGLRDQITRRWREPIERQDYALRTATVGAE